MIEANPESLLIYRELLEHLRTICHAMDRDYAFVLRCTYFEPRSNDEIARRLDIYNDQVDQLRHCALRYIREKLYKAGVIEKHPMPQFRKVKRMRFDLNRSEFYEPTEVPRVD